MNEDTCSKAAMSAWWRRLPSRAHKTKSDTFLQFSRRCKHQEKDVLQDELDNFI